MNQSQKHVTEGRWRARERLAQRDDAWREAFTSQLADPKLRRRALNTARRSVSLLQQAGAQVASAHVEDLLASAIADTWRGVLSWDPGEVTLLDHVQAAIRSRARDEWRRAKKFPSVSLDACEEDDEDERATALRTEAEEALASNVPATDAGQRLIALEAFDRMCALAGADRELVTALDAMRKGYTERADLMRMLGWSARRYDRVRRRLDRLLRELPAGIGERIPAAYSCASSPHATRRTMGRDVAARHRGTGDAGGGTPAERPHVPEVGNGRIRERSSSHHSHGSEQTTRLAARY